MKNYEQLFKIAIQQILLNQAVLLSGTLDPVANKTHDVTCELIEEISNAVEEQEADGKDVKDLLVQVDAFLRSWQPDDRSPMAKQFGKMIEEVQEFLIREV